MSLGPVRAIFAVAGVYDLALGAAFLFFGPQVYATFGVAPPNHWGYVQFGALVLAVFGGMFFFVAGDPVRHRNLMPCGMALKISYTGLVSYYWVAGECPLMFKPFAVADGIMLVLFLMAYRQTPRMPDVRGGERHD